MGITKKQLAVFNFIKEYMKEHGLSPTQKEIKDHFELKSFGSVQRYLKYLKDNGLIDNDWNQRRGIQLNADDHRELYHQYQSNIDIETVPLIGTVAAGNPIEAIETTNESIPLPTSLIPQKGKKHFALKVEGQSMIDDGIFNGDIAFIRQEHNATDGETIVAVVDGEATLKKIKKEKDHISLIPANSKMKPIIITSEQDFKIVGKLVGLLRVY